MLGHLRPATLFRRYVAADGDRVRLPDEALRHLGEALTSLDREIAERLTLIMRDHLARTVDSVSPLAVDACALEGLDLDDVAMSLRPDHTWRPWLHVPATSRRPRWHPPAGLPLADLLHIGNGSSLLALVSIVREVGSQRGALGFRIGGRTLGMAMRLPAAALVGRGSRGVLTLREPLPETLMLALPGRPIGEVVDHPLLAARTYRVLDARPDPDGGTRIVFDARPLRWRVPWMRTMSQVPPSPLG